MRKHYIDNLRSLVILLLFPFHTSRMFTSGDPFYVEGIPNFFCQLFVNLTSIWFMNLLFVLAGISTALSLQKRSIKQFTKDRVMKLLIPFIFGVLLTIPIQTYYAERFHNGYQGGYFEQYRLFFTKATDLTGYRGGFTPAHLWFILFLFIISMLSLPVIIYIKKNGRKPYTKTPSVYRLIPLFILVMVFSVIRIGEAIGQYMTYFLIGYLVLSRDEILDELKRKKYILTVLALVISITATVLSYSVPFNGNDYALQSLFVSAIRHLASWTIILALLGLAQEFMNFTNKWSNYMAKSSFPIYFVHQTVLIVIGFYVLTNVTNTVAVFLLIMIPGFIISILLCELFRRIPITAFIFGMKK